MSSSVSPVPTASDPAKAAELAKLPGFNRQVKKTLDQSDFLKLLATQLANQDPLSPSDDLNSISQMSTFSSVQQMGELVTSLKSFIVSQDFASAQGMLGKFVTATSDKNVTAADGSAVTITTRTSGYVTSVGYDEAGVSQVKVGDRAFSPSDITAISSSAATAAEGSGSGTPPTVPSANELLGKVVTVTEDQSTTTGAGTPITVKVSTKGIVTGHGTNAEGVETIIVGGRTFTVSQITALAAAKNTTT